MSYNTIGSRIKYHRKRLGLTQEQLAQRLGVSAQAVSKWENNLSCPDISILPMMSELFGVSIDELLGRQSVAQAEPVKEDEKPSVVWNWEWGKKKGPLLYAIYVIMAGGLMLLNHILSLDVSWWTVLWTLGVFYIGVSGLLGGFSVFSLTVTLAGAYFLLSAYGLLSFELSWGVALPAMLLLWGLGMLIDVFCGKKWRKIKSNPGVVTIHNNKKMSSTYSCEDGYLRCEMAFGETHRSVQTDLLRGGRIDTSFGSFSVDFSDCKAVAPDCSIQVENGFGTLTLLIPKRFRAELVSNDGFTAASDIEGSPNEITEGCIRFVADNGFGSLSLRYID